MKNNECTKCEMDLKDPIFWDNHQTMMDGHIWCVASKTTRVDDLTADILNKYLGVYSEEDLDRID